ncbi:histone H2A-Bbd type 2/3-like [Octodon degus]|uniref:Histone H2A n=1 Tax=Octodon degus TaxID=10160 RepID=A0A6P3FX36_OCTDE|nr:histone H2A-Bbd type 2/3-like [Octodon degus]
MDSARPGQPWRRPRRSSSSSAGQQNVAVEPRRARHSRAGPSRPSSDLAEVEAAEAAETAVAVEASSRPVPSMPGRSSHQGSRNRQGSSGRPRGRSGRQRARSPTARAELIFSVSQVERALREGRYAQRLSCSASVFLAATLQSLTATMLESAGREARYRPHRRITPELLDLAILNDVPLCTLLGGATISRVAPSRP